MHADGSATDRGLQRNCYFIETQGPCEFKICSDSTIGHGMRQAAATTSRATEGARGRYDGTHTH
eukprot:746384-Pyramimonas_sp.AAC.1